METQATNLPVLEEVTPKEGELEESQTPVAEPVEEATSEQETASTEIIVSASEETSSTPPAEETESSVPEPELLPEQEPQEPQEPEESQETQETQETQEPQETQETKETQDPQETESEESTVVPLETVPPTRPPLTKDEIVMRLQQVNAEPEKYARSEVDALKKAYFRARNAETQEKRNKFIEEGGQEEEFFAQPEDELDTTVKNLVNEFRNKKAKLEAEEERQKEQNLILKQHLLEQMKALTESQDDFQRRYTEFRELQHKWKLIKAVPREQSRELGRNYLLYSERFYDLVKINNQFREYDFKKNYEAKIALCEAAEKLASEKDFVQASRKMQKLFDRWKEIGLVPKDERPILWKRFRAAAKVISDRNQERKERLKNREATNLAEKTAICETIEAIDTDNMKSMRKWEQQADEVKALQEKWREIGHTGQQNEEIYARFRAACDNFFSKKTAFFRNYHHQLEQNLERKRAILAKAEELKESTDWWQTAQQLTELQAEWRTIGPVPQKYSDAIWKQFKEACDYFFKRKSKESSNLKSDEYGHLKAKQAVIKKINEIDTSLSDEDALALLREHIAEWNSIGFVPFKEKENLRHTFRKAVDAQFDRLKVKERDRHLQQFRENINELSNVPDKEKKLYYEREKLVKVYERMKNELATSENNIGFFTVSSKGGDGLKKELERKIVALKDNMQVILKKIETIDENLD